MEEPSEDPEVEPEPDPDEVDELEPDPDGVEDPVEDPNGVEEPEPDADGVDEPGMDPLAQKPLVVASAEGSEAKPHMVPRAGRTLPTFSFRGTRYE